MVDERVFIPDLSWYKQVAMGSNCSEFEACIVPGQHIVCPVSCLILRSAGGHMFSVLHEAGLGYDLAASIMGLTALVTSLLASHFWRTYVEIKAHLLVEKFLIMRY